MPDIIDKAFRNYAALPPLAKIRVKAAFSGIGMFFLYLLYEMFTQGWQRALGIFIAVTAFVAVVTIATIIGNILGKVFGQKAGTTLSVIIIFGFIGLVLYLIGSNWG